MMMRDAIVQQILAQQAQRKRAGVPTPFMPPTQPVRSLPPTMMGTPPKVQQEALYDYLGKAQRAVDPVDAADPHGAEAIGKALKKYFTLPDTEGGAAP